MSVTLRKRKNADGTTSLRLDIYHNEKRTIETLKNLKLIKATNVADRETNKKNLQQAEVIRAIRSAELESNNYSMVSDAGKKTIITVWMQVFIDGYNKKDKRNMQGALNRFSDFLKEENLAGMTFGCLTALVIEDFIEYLERKSIGEGASSYYNRFKKMLKQAYRKQLMKENILDFVERKVKGKAKKKDVLTIDELVTLAGTPTESKEVRRAFLLSCLTGLRWVDVKKGLKWENIDLESCTLELNQSKTNEVVKIPLNKTAIELLGEKGNAENLVFDLPSDNGANKTLKAWIKRAKIEKKITWHNARHSFGTNLILNDVGVLTASQLLGHTSLKHTQRYVTTAREMKERATDKLNFKI
jgi:integrase